MAYMSYVLKDITNAYDFSHHSVHSLDTMHIQPSDIVEANTNFSDILRYILITQINEHFLLHHNIRGQFKWMEYFKNFLYPNNSTSSDQNLRDTTLSCIGLYFPLSVWQEVDYSSSGSGSGNGASTSNMDHIGNHRRDLPIRNICVYLIVVITSEFSSSYHYVLTCASLQPLRKISLPEIYRVDHLPMIQHLSLDVTDIKTAISDRVLRVKHLTQYHHKHISSKDITQIHSSFFLNGDSDAATAPSDVVNGKEAPKVDSLLVHSSTNRDTYLGRIFYIYHETSVTLFLTTFSTHGIVDNLNESDINIDDLSERISHAYSVLDVMPSERYQKATLYATNSHEFFVGIETKDSILVCDRKPISFTSYCLQLLVNICDIIDPLRNYLSRDIKYLVASNNSYYCNICTIQHTLSVQSSAFNISCRLPEEDINQGKSDILLAAIVLAPLVFQSKCTSQCAIPFSDFVGYNVMYHHPQHNLTASHSKAVTRHLEQQIHAFILAYVKNEFTRLHLLTIVRNTVNNGEMEFREIEQICLEVCEAVVPLFYFMYYFERCFVKLLRIRFDFSNRSSETDFKSDNDVVDLSFSQDADKILAFYPVQFDVIASTVVRIRIAKCAINMLERFAQSTTSMHNYGKTAFTTTPPSYELYLRIDQTNMQISIKHCKEQTNMIQPLDSSLSSSNNEESISIFDLNSIRLEEKLYNFILELENCVK